MWVRRKLHLHHLLDIVLDWRPVGILNDDHVGPANHSFPWLERWMLRIFIPILADPSRYPAMWTVTGLAVENRLRWVLGHVVADLGLVAAASLENFVQLSQPLCHARLLEAFAILAEVGRAAAMADRRAQHLLVLRIEPGFQGADRVVLPSGLMPPRDRLGWSLMRRPSSPGRCRGSPRWGARSRRSCRRHPWCRTHSSRHSTRP